MLKVEAIKCINYAIGFMAIPGYGKDRWTLVKKFSDTCQIFGSGARVRSG
jgi:hypothetical protein